LRFCTIFMFQCRSWSFFVIDFWQKLFAASSLTFLVHLFFLKVRVFQ
jgi:hypothetical protein